MGGTAEPEHRTPQENMFAYPRIPPATGDPGQVPKPAPVSLFEAGRGKGGRTHAFTPALSGYFASASHFSLGLQAPVAPSHIDAAGGCLGNSSRSGCFLAWGAGGAALLLVREELGL